MAAFGACVEFELEAYCDKRSPSSASPAWVADEAATTVSERAADPSRFRGFERWGATEAGLRRMRDYPSSISPQGGANGVGGLYVADELTAVVAHRYSRGSGDPPFVSSESPSLAHQAVAVASLSPSPPP